MTENYHTHTFRCHHASGSEREYIENAVKAGLKTLGFSDHTPYFFKGDYYSTFRMTPRETEEYFLTLGALREEYRDDIKIYIGFETEYYPAHFGKLLRFYEQFPVDYIILGQHYSSNEYDGANAVRPTDDPVVLKEYTDQVIEGMKTGFFTYIAHPDLLNFTGPEDIYDAEAGRLCAEAKKDGIPLEMNLLGMRGDRGYPRRRFFQTAARTGNEVILGLDAHRPEDVSDPVSEKTALGWVKELGLRLIERPALRRIPHAG